MTYSIDFRKKILEVKEKENLSFTQLSKRFCVGRNTIFTWTKSLEPKTSRNKPATKINMEKLKEDIENHSDAYQYERAKRLGVSASGIGYALKRLGVTYKKNFISPEGEIRREARISE